MFQVLSTNLSHKHCFFIIKLGLVGTINTWQSVNLLLMIYCLPSCFLIMLTLFLFPLCWASGDLRNTFLTKVIDSILPYSSNSENPFAFVTSISIHIMLLYFLYHRFMGLEVQSMNTR